MTVDVIIPAYKPDQEFFKLLDRLEEQTVPVGQIIVVNTEEKYFNRLVYGKKFKEDYRNLRIKHISAHEFDHGGTRRRAVKDSEADVFVMMTQDAIPADNKLIENLLRPLNEKDVAVSYARQLAREDAGEIEKFTRVFNYPEEPVVKGKDDLPSMGIKTYFCSDVCAAYKRDVYDQLGGFVKRAIFNEDMLFAAKAVKENYKVAYAADARVYHSHNYTGMQQFHRNFDLGVSQAQHPEVFEGISSESEGISMVKKTVKHLWDSGHKTEIIRLFYTSGCKFIGYRLGKNYKKLPKKAVLWCTSNRNYWRK
ncbi:MAG: glycosyltransferase family 2 protein [Lachnospiraceae bacterium]|nr:glycosyltransferase family 2 protein [Lachnospiraceae bacterium]